jgi:tRNA A37 threonylcarbamoyladenosine biosynthesis protein TsaE
LIFYIFRLTIGENFIKQIESNVTFPLKEDLYGAEDAFTRLQKTYRLDVNSLSNGIIYYHNEETRDKLHIDVYRSDAVMNFDDCYEIGEYFHRINDNDNAINWMRLSLDKLNDEHETISIRDQIEISILENLAYYSFLTGNFDDSVR